MTISGVIITLFLLYQFNKLDDLARAESARKFKEKMKDGE